MRRIRSFVIFSSTVPITPMDGVEPPDSATFICLTRVRRFAYRRMGNL